MRVKLLINIEHKVILALSLASFIDTFQDLFKPNIIYKTFQPLEEIICEKFDEIGMA